MVLQFHSFKLLHIKCIIVICGTKSKILVTECLSKMASSKRMRTGARFVGKSFRNLYWVQSHTSSIVHLYLMPIFCKKIEMMGFLCFTKIYKACSIYDKQMGKEC